MIVAGERQHTAVPRGAGRIGVLQGVGRAVDAGALAVPDAEHTIDLGARKEPNLLAAPDRRRGEILVEPGDESDVLCLKERLCTPQRVVVHAERRAPIAGDEARGVEPGEAIAFALQHRKADQRLDAGQIDSLGFHTVFVVQPHLQQRHSRQSPQNLAFGALAQPVVKSMGRQCQYRTAATLPCGNRNRRLIGAAAGSGGARASV